MSSHLRTELSILGFMNAYSTGRSGGDVAFIEIFKRWPHARRTVVTSQLGAQLCQEMGLECGFVPTTYEKKWSNVYLTYLLRLAKGCSKALKVQQVDLIYISSDIMPDVLPAFMLYLKLRGQGRRPMVIAKSYHINSSHRWLSAFLQKISLKFLAAFADRIITSSSSSRDAIHKQGVPLDKLWVNPLGINLKSMSAAFSQSTSPRLQQVICLGRIHPAKGVFEFLDIWAKVSKADPTATLLLVGSGSAEHMQELASKVERLGLTHSVKLTGFVTDEVKIAHLRASKGLVLPSREEGFSLAILEAFACGVQAVAFPLPVLKELFLPELITVPIETPEAWVPTLLKLLKTDEASLEKNAQSLIRKAQTFDWDQCALKEWEIAFPLGRDRTHKISFSN